MIGVEWWLDLYIEGHIKCTQCIIHLTLTRCPHIIWIDFNIVNIFPDFHPNINQPFSSCFNTTGSWNTINIKFFLVINVCKMASNKPAKVFATKQLYYWVQCGEWVEGIDAELMWEKSCICLHCVHTLLYTHVILESAVARGQLSPRLQISSLYVLLRACRGLVMFFHESNKPCNRSSPCQYNALLFGKGWHQSFSSGWIRM